MCHAPVVWRQWLRWLGVILFLTGAQLALGAGPIPEVRTKANAITATAALAICNIGSSEWRISLTNEV